MTNSSDLELITEWVIEAERDAFQRAHSESASEARTFGSTSTPSLVVTSDPATADRQPFRSPPA